MFTILIILSYLVLGMILVMASNYPNIDWDSFEFFKLILISPLYLVIILFISCIMYPIIIISWILDILNINISFNPCKTKKNI